MLDKILITFFFAFLGGMSGLVLCEVVVLRSKVQSQEKEIKFLKEELNVLIKEKAK